MAERDHIVISLVKELLGPRNGAFEILPKNRDPRTEYIIGVLAPEQEERDLEDIDADVDEFIEEVADDENQGTEGIVIAPPSVFSPALDPKSQPRSIGLSFVIIADDSSSASIDIGLTWARYESVESGWQRKPVGRVLAGIRIDEDCSSRWQTDHDLELYMRVHRQSHNTFRVSLYVINTRKQREEKKPSTSDFVFQPQIRVHCVSGCLTSIDQTSSHGFDDPLSAEDVELAMLYRDRAALARGHLCGAVWKAVDPERPHPELTSPPDPPFTWVDASLIEEEYRRVFSPADVRTELLPCYPVESPETHWAWSEDQPEFRPLVLAETWNSNELKLHLQPLVDGYNQWIAIQQRVVPTLPTHWQSVALSNLEKCQAIADRMAAGITCLVDDGEARLAFCFANQAIALQSQWTRKGIAVPWRPFQLAFILLNIRSIAYPAHSDREICDLLWFPTGGGKTEAYLGLTAFTLALRRIRARSGGQDDTGGGVSVLSRYTLRLLTIQQFRRALGVITACEVLRVQNLNKKGGPIGWRPRDCSVTSDFLWGGMRFSAGMWVGGNVTPNNLAGFPFKAGGKMRYVAGALDILRGVGNYKYSGPDAALEKKLRGMFVEAEGDPAQVLTCPACQSILAIPEEGLGTGKHTLHFVFSGRLKKSIMTPSLLGSARISVDEALITSHSSEGTQTLSITFHVSEGSPLKWRNIDDWWYETIQKHIPVSGGGLRLLAARPSRPGYFICTFQNSQGTQVENNFEIYCPDPVCPLNQGAWAEQVPVNVASVGMSSSGGNHLLVKSAQAEKKKWTWQNVPAFVQFPGQQQKAGRIPIPAYTTDDQIYHRCPSMVIATVDKFARLAFEPKAASLFGNVTHYHSRWGFYREGCPPSARTQEGVAAHPPGFASRQYLHTAVNRFLPPDLIIQDELHLLEGPLGSMVGLYETAIDALCEHEINRVKIRPKYVASTATVRQADNQIRSLFARNLAQFPPSAVSVDDRFFARTRESHPLESSHAGRLYIAVAGPGKGAQTPIVRIWSALLRAADERQRAGAGDDLDSFWTLVGYFNALRELAGAAALYRQDIPERIQSFGEPVRNLGEQALELSSRANSLALPGYLERLGKAWQEDAVLATSMFGTGVDVDRLGLMVVHGQPKSTSSYIQATGRVGRRQGGLVITFFRVSRPRDLDHYEFFTGYHRMLYRAVEPVTVTPFAPRARERSLGPLSVALLRQGQKIDGEPIENPWYIEQRVTDGVYSEASLMATHRHDPEVEALPDVFERRAMQQPDGRRPRKDAVEQEMNAQLDRWQTLAYEQAKSPDTVNDRFVYSESSMLRNPERGVVLGDAQHQMRQLPVAFENTPNSLRDVEVTTQFKE